jgi:hypothetical protein
MSGYTALNGMMIREWLFGKKRKGGGQFEMGLSQHFTGSTEESNEKSQSD